MCDYLSALGISHLILTLLPSAVVSIPNYKHTVENKWTYNRKKKKITKTGIPRKIQMAKSKAQTHQTNGQKLLISYLVQAFSNEENGGLNLGL